MKKRLMGELMKRVIDRLINKRMTDVQLERIDGWIDECIKKGFMD